MRRVTCSSAASLPCFLLLAVLLQKRNTYMLHKNSSLANDGTWNRLWAAPRDGVGAWVDSRRILVRESRREHVLPRLRRAAFYSSASANSSSRSTEFIPLWGERVEGGNGRQRPRGVGRWRASQTCPGESLHHLATLREKYDNDLLIPSSSRQLASNSCFWWVPLCKAFPSSAATGL